MILIEWILIKFNYLYIEIVFLFDFKSLIFRSIVFFISCMVIIYRKSYMNGDKNSILFVILIFCFVCSIILLIFSPNIISLILGWDGLGLRSYLLVVYYQGKKSNKSGILVAISNRIGDGIILICIGWIYRYGSWNIFMYFDYIFFYNDYIFIIFLTLAGITKRAQIPFSAWLPAAMAAPTPVSSLVHSSTLVTAGVYLIIRYYNYLNLRLVSNFLLFCSCLTIFISGLTANFKFDLKNIIALSTISQMALIIGSLRLGIVEICFFHLLIHAIFKALLFMCAGYFIHNMNGNQDIRLMGSLINQFPLVCLCFNIANLSLCGFPFLPGFYSKDLIIENLLLINLGVIPLFFFLISTGFTIIYTFRLIFYLIFNDLILSSYNNFRDEDYYIIFPIILLLIVSLVSGSCLMWIIFPFNFIFLPLFYKMITLILILFGVFLSWLIYRYRDYTNKIFNFNFFGSILFIYIIIRVYKKTVFNIGNIYIYQIDRGLIVQFGGQGVKSILFKFYYLILNYQFLRNLLSFLFVFIIIFIYLIFYFYIFY